MKLSISEPTRIFLAYIQYKRSMERAGIKPSTIYRFAEYREQWLSYEVQNG